MDDIKKFSKGSHNLMDLLDVISYKIQFARDNPDYFYPEGIWVFCGSQGKGKTLSAVLLLQQLCKAYPKAIVCTNVDVKGIDNKIVRFYDYSQLQTLSNGVHGVIFFLDELHVIWNSLESKEIPISEMATFCQMRKDRRVIIGMAQVYGRISKPIREQLKYVIDCHCYFKLFNWNYVLDPTEANDDNGNVVCKILSRYWFFHTRKLYTSYDTLYKVKRPKRIEKKGAKK